MFHNGWVAKLSDQMSDYKKINPNVIWIAHGDDTNHYRNPLKFFAPCAAVLNKSQDALEIYLQFNYPDIEYFANDYTSWLEVTSGQRGALTCTSATEDGRKRAGRLIQDFVKLVELHDIKPTSIENLRKNYETWRDFQIERLTGNLFFYYEPEFYRSHYQTFQVMYNHSNRYSSSESNLAREQLIIEYVESWPDYLLRNSYG